MEKMRTCISYRYLDLFILCIVCVCFTSVAVQENPGFCPEPKGFAFCVELCSNDTTCQRHEKCCFNGCGHVCMPVSSIQHTSSVTVVPTSTATPTTPAPTTPTVAPEVYEMRGELTITGGAVWSDNLSNDNSAEYQELKSGVEEQINKALDIGELQGCYRGVKDMTFREGSVIASYVLEFADPAQPVSADVVIRKIKSAAENNSFGAYSVDPTSVVIIEIVVTSPIPDTDLPDWAIALIPVGGTFLLFLLGLIVQLYFRCHPFPGTPDDCRSSDLRRQPSYEMPDDVSCRSSATVNSEE